MDFYVDPAFFIISGLIAIVSFCLGVAQKPLARFGGLASLVMLGFLFSKSLDTLGFFIGFIALSCCLAFWVMHLFAHECRNRIAWYRVALALQILPLFIYKTSVAFDCGILGFIGISYITFKAVQVLIEIRDGLIEKLDLLDHLYFLVFFPTFTSGPIMRSRAFTADIHTPLSRDEYLTRFYRGTGWFILGALYKFIGASLASWLMWFLPAAIGDTTTGAAVLSQLAYGFSYGLYLFFDFAGYSDMAMGLGLVMGVEVPRNFRAPFCSVDIKDFWNRWHITLSWWLRDYVFMRFTEFALDRELFKSSLTTACIAFLINMTLMGCWHGFTLDYVVYGLYHGVLLAACEILQKKWGFYKRHKKENWFKVCSWLVTMVCVFFGFALFSGQVSSLVFG